MKNFWLEMNEENIYSLELTEDKTERLDALFNNPFLIKKIERLKKRLSNKNNTLFSLGDKRVAGVNGGKRLPKGLVVIQSERTTIPYISATDIKDGNIDFENCKKITPEIYELLKNYNLKKDDLVITIVGTIGEVGIVNSPLQENVFSENVARIRKKTDDINAKFLIHILTTSFCKMQTDRLAVGSLQYKLSLKNCREINISLPTINKEISLDMQEKILNKIEKFENEVESRRGESQKIILETNEKIRKILDLEKLPEKSEFNTYSSILELDRIDALFNSPFRNKIKNIIEKKDYDILEKLIEIQKKGEILPSAFYNLVELYDVDENFGEVNNVKEVTNLGSDKVVFRNGELLISRLQPEKGKIIIVNEKTDGFLGSGELIPIKIISEKVLPEYLWIILRTPYILRQWEYSIRGSSRERIGDTELYETLIPLPDIRIQEKIIKLVKEDYGKAKKLIKESKELKEKISDIFMNEILNEK